MTPKLQQLKDRLATVSDLQSAAAVLGWDQSTYMPPGGADARGRQIATLATLAHEHLVHPATGELLDALRDHAAELPHDSDDAALLRIAQYDYDQATKIPADLTGRLSAHAAASYTVWADARPMTSPASSPTWRPPWRSAASSPAASRTSTWLTR